jgi:hypothetical protein
LRNEQALAQLPSWVRKEGAINVCANLLKEGVPKILALETPHWHLEL